MNTKYRLPKGQRMKKSRSAVHPATKLSGNKPYKVKRPLWIEPIGKSWWYSITKDQWEQGYNPKDRMCTSYYGMGSKDVYSLKAAKRLVHKWDVPRGTVFRISLPFVKHDIYVTKN